MQWKRLTYYLLINVVISVITTLIILNIWERARQSELEQAASVAILPTALPTEARTAMPSVTPTLALRPHQVQSGETLGDISSQYGVTIEELMQVNNLEDPNTLDVGQVVYIPVPTATPGAPTQTPSPGQPAEPDQAGVQGGQVEIVSVIGVGDLDTERVVLGDAGGEKHSLTGWQLQDEDEHLYVFPQATLYENGQINLNTKVGVDTPLDLFWNLNEPVWESGEIVTLMDGEGNVQATYQVP